LNSQRQIRRVVKLKTVYNSGQNGPGGSKENVLTKLKWRRFDFTRTDFDNVCGNQKHNWLLLLNCEVLVVK
jgi:hypothetical protein